MLNIYEQVDQNKRRSIFIIVLFVAFVIGFFYLLGQFLETDPSLVLVAAIFSLISAATSYFWGDKIVLGLSKAKPATKKEYFDFYTTAENLAIAAQVPLPNLYIINSPAMNAFATGKDPKSATICATTGLLQKLNRTELEAVVAHEMSHIGNYDTRLMIIVSILVGMITLISDWLMRSSRIFSNRRGRDRRVNPIAMTIGLIALLLSPLIAKLIQLAISRRREYLADATAVKLTKQPQGLIDALAKLSQNPIPLKTSTAMAHLYIVNPFAKISSLFSTHPPIEERITALKKML